MTQEERAQEILTILHRTFSLPDWETKPKKPFATLIRTVLSQATNDKNRDKAFKSLSEKFHITPTVLSEADVKAIEEAIRIGGLHRNKSKVIKELSRVIVEKFNGTLDFIYSTSLEEARKLLIALPGIGPKTADVVLLFSANKPVLPVDTHVNRVSKRLELAASKADYERVRLTLQSLYSPNDYLAVHILLIMLGRKYCKARHPSHASCPVNMLCPSAKLGD
ncbi:MAG: endonuclease III [Candidatus Bathyarchaeota archaeon]|nr:endonuclease III [Candidatus Bathyarchaeota archaeon]